MQKYFVCQFVYFRSFCVNLCHFVSIYVTLRKLEEFSKTMTTSTRTKIYSSEEIEKMMKWDKSVITRWNLTNRKMRELQWFLGWEVHCVPKVLIEWIQFSQIWAWEKFSYLQSKNQIIIKNSASSN